MKQHEKRLAAAVYDRAPSASADDRAVFVGTGALRGGRTVLCDLVLAGDPPEALRLAVAETLAVLRVTWIALLQCDDGPERRLLDAVHAALQCELAAVEWTWSGGAGDGHALARVLAGRRERHRCALAAPPPVGVGLLIPGQARANEALPGPLVAAWEALARELGGVDPARASGLRDAAYDALGAWRLREVEATDAAASIAEAIRRSGDEKVRPIAPEPAVLRAAS
jgi:hypothetical protein